MIAHPHTPFFARKLEVRGHLFSALDLRVFPGSYTHKTRSQIQQEVQAEKDVANVVHAIIDTGATTLVLSAEDAGKVFGLDVSIIRRLIEQKKPYLFPDGTRLTPKKVQTSGGEHVALMTQTVVSYLNTQTREQTILAHRRGFPLPIPTSITNTEISCAGKPILHLFNLDMIGSNKDTTMLVPFYSDGPVEAAAHRILHLND